MTGTSHATATALSPATAPTAQKLALQPKCWSIREAAGRPTTWAIMTPPSRIDSARPRSSGPTSWAETATAMPKKAEAASAVTTRATTSAQNSGATAPSAWPSTNTRSRQIRAFLRGTRSSATVSRGPPITMPSAKMAMRYPTVDTDTSNSADKLGRSPETMISVVLRQKTPIPSVKMAMGM